MPDPSDHLHFRLEIPGLPEMEPMLREFASRAITLADVEGSRHDALLDALISAVNLVEREIMEGGDDPVDLSIGVTIDAAAIELRASGSGNCVVGGAVPACKVH